MAGERAPSLGQTPADLDHVLETSKSAESGLRPRRTTLVECRREGRCLLGRSRQWKAGKAGGDGMKSERHFVEGGRVDGWEEAEGGRVVTV